MLTDLAWAPDVVCSVSELVGRARELMESGIGSVWVEGEVRNLRIPASGHAYFSLGDGRSQIRAVCFRSVLRALSVSLEEGGQVLAWGRVSVYEPRGDLQLVVDILEPVDGLGVLLREYEARKRRLEAEGWFAADRKRPVPSLPRAVGVVTSPSGAALRDILQVLGRRAPGVRVILSPANVQGEGAAGEIRRSLERVAGLPEVDLVLLARGGGSLEDLWPFNDEDLVRAVARCPVPVITGVGHETDVTLVDLAADVRAPTPSAAAELAVRDWGAWVEALRSLEGRLERAVRTRIQGLRGRLAGLDPGLRSPRGRIEQRRVLVDRWAERLDGLWDRRLLAARGGLARAAGRLDAAAPHRRWALAGARVQGLAARLERAVGRALGVRRERVGGLELQVRALSPYGALRRGYALVRDEQGNVVRDAARCSVGQPLTVLLARGELGARVIEVRPAGDRG